MVQPTKHLITASVFRRGNYKIKTMSTIPKEGMGKLKVSDCCGEEPRGNGDNDSEDYGICPCCGEHCEYIEQDEDLPEVL
jgi:hypothetical protein